MTNNEERTWWKEAVVYQIWPRSFKDSNDDGVGDLRGIISKLDHLKELGVTCVWLSPCYKSPLKDNGYDISDYEDIGPLFGTMEDWKEMVDGMHQRGIRLFMDLVVNHTSDEHPWFIESRSSEDNPKRDFYIWKKGKDGKPPNNWISIFQGPAWDYDEKTDSYYMHLFANFQPDLNWENPEVRKEVFAMMNRWFERGIDGFRLDAISFISKVPGFPDSENGTGSEFFTNGPRIHEYLNMMYKEVFSKYDCATVGECGGATVESALMMVSKEREELNMVFHFELNDTNWDSSDKFKPKAFSLKSFKDVITRWTNGLFGKGWNSLYLSNHDMPRSVSFYGNDSPEFRVLSAKLLATLNLSLMGTPYIYQGDEFGMTNCPWTDISEMNDVEALNYYNANKDKQPHDELWKNLCRVSRDNSRTPVQWDDTENAGFTKGKPWIKVNPNYKEINAKKCYDDPDSVFHYYKKMIALRKSEPALIYGVYTLFRPDDEELFLYTRELDGKKFYVVLNWTNKELDFKPDIDISGMTVRISNYEAPQAGKLRPYEAVIYSN